jgi:hypothetical protein
MGVSNSTANANANPVTPFNRVKSAGKETGTLRHWSKRKRFAPNLGTVFLSAANLEYLVPWSGFILNSQPLTPECSPNDRFIVIYKDLYPSLSLTWLSSVSIPVGFGAGVWSSSPALPSAPNAFYPGLRLRTDDNVRASRAGASEAGSVEQARMQEQTMAAAQRVRSAAS